MFTTSFYVEVGYETNKITILKKKSDCLFTIRANFKLALSAETVVQVSSASDSKPDKYEKEMVKKKRPFGVLSVLRLHLLPITINACNVKSICL